MTKETAHINAMAAMLMQCRDRFREYAAAHRAKTPPDHTKAIRNAEMADEIDNVLRIVDGDDSRGQYYLMKLPQRVAFADPQPDLTSPVPMILRRAREGEEPTDWVGGDILFRDEHWARKSLRMALPEYREYCEARRFLDHKLAPASYSGPVCLGEDYADEVAELACYEVETPPAWCFTAKEVPFEVDFEGMVESHIQDEHYEDASVYDLTKYDEIIEAVSNWAEAQTIRSYQYVGQIIVLDPVRYDEERARCQAVVETWEAGEAA